MNTTMTDRNTSESHAAPAMERMRYARRFCRTTALVAVMMLLNAVIWPSWAVAVEVERQKEAQAQARWEARHQSLDQVLLGIRQEAQDRRSMMADTLAERDQGFLGKARSLLGIEQAPAEALPRLQWLSQRAANLHEQALASFDETEAHLRKKELPRRILDRNDRAREEYQRAYTTMRETLNQALDSDSLGEQEEAMAALVDFMDRFTLDKPRDPFDPNKLPWRTPDPDKTPTPARSAEALSQRTGLPCFEQGLELASLNNNAALSVAPGAPWTRPWPLPWMRRKRRPSRPKPPNSTTTRSVSTNGCATTSSSSPVTAPFKAPSTPWNWARAMPSTPPACSSPCCEPRTSRPATPWAPCASPPTRS